MKKKLLALFMALAMVISTVAYAPAYAKTTKDSYGEYAYSVLKYMDKNLTQRRAGTDAEKKAADYLVKKLKSFGYKVEIQKFEYTRKGETYQSQNIIVTKKGKSSKQVIVGSHYDSVGTNGVDDNGSGTVINLETARRFAKKTPKYTVKFVFFGAEEVGLKGSKAYADAMTEKEIAKTVYMINMDSLLAGTYRYVYSGNYNAETGKVDDAWPALQALELSDALGTGMRLNNTELNYDYPSPSTGNWSDHASFRYKMPYLYFEAVNWELPDDPNHPEYGSSGAYETEIGEVMHVPDRDNLTFIEKTWGSRGKKTITAYCKLLEAVLYQVSPDGLVKPSTDKLEAAIEKAEKLSRENFSSKSRYNQFVKALAAAKKASDANYVLLKDQAKIDAAVKDLTTAMKYAKKSIKDADIKVKSYKGKASVTVKYDGKTLKSGKDYTVKVSTSKKSKTGVAVVTGKNSYIGQVSVSFKL